MTNTERERLTEAEKEAVRDGLRMSGAAPARYVTLHEAIKKIKADAYAAGLADRTPAPSATQALRDAADDMASVVAYGWNAAALSAWLRDRADRLDAAPTDPAEARPYTTNGQPDLLARLQQSPVAPTDPGTRDVVVRVSAETTTEDMRDVARWLAEEADQRVRHFPQRRDGVDALMRGIAADLDLHARLRTPGTEENDE